MIIIIIALLITYLLLLLFRVTILDFRVPRDVKIIIIVKLYDINFHTVVPTK